MGLYYFRAESVNFNMFLFMCLTILQWSNIICSVQYVASRYVSVANVFMMYFVSLFIYRFLGVYAIPITACLGIYYFVNLKAAFRMFENI